MLLLDIKICPDYTKKSQFIITIGFILLPRLVKEGVRGKIEIYFFPIFAKNSALLLVLLI